MANRHFLDRRLRGCVNFVLPESGNEAKITCHGCFAGIQIVVFTPLNLPDLPDEPNYPFPFVFSVSLEIQYQYSKTSEQRTHWGRASCLL